MLLIKVELCNWKQSNYNEAEPEMVQCQLLFKGVSTFEMQPNITVDFDEILEIGLIDDFRKIKMVLNSNEDVTVLIVNAKEVNLIKDNR